MNSFDKKALGCTRILWDDREDETEVTFGLVKDKTWAEVYETSACEVDFKFVAGTREAYLNAEAKTEAKKLSQLGLKKSYSKIYPVGHHFFFVAVNDTTKSYYPTSEVIFDIPTAHALFGSQRAKSAAKLLDKAKFVCKLWNEEFFDNLPIQQVILYILYLKSILLVLIMFANNDI